MSTYNSGGDKGNDADKKSERSKKPEDTLDQEIAQLEFQLEAKKMIKKLRTGEMDIEDAEIIPFYSPCEWESYEQYKDIVGGATEVEEFKQQLREWEEELEE